MAIPVKVEYEVSTGKSLRSETCGMEFNASLIKAMTSTLYNYKKEAVAREYATNITDAHYAAGCPEKAGYIKVPTKLDPNLEFHDKGLGLSVEDIYSVYTVIGLSTKRDCNLSNGSLGMGAKSYISVSEQMTVTSVKDGVKIVVLCYMNRKGELAADLKSEKPTSESNGTIISIPVKISDVDEWKKVIAKVLAPFRVPHNYNTLGDYQPQFDKLQFWCKEVREKGFIFKEHKLDHRSNKMVLMGDVLYDLPDFDNLICETKAKDGIISYAKEGCYITKFDIGDIDHAPSREYISYDDLTYRKVKNRVNKDAIKMYRDFFKDIDLGGMSYYKFYNKCYSTSVWDSLEHYILPFTEGYKLYHLKESGYHFYKIYPLLESSFGRLRGIVPSAVEGDLVFSYSVESFHQARLVKMEVPLIVYSEKEKGLYKMKDTLYIIMDNLDIEQPIIYVDSKEKADNVAMWFGSEEVICGDQYSPSPVTNKKTKSKGSYGIKEDFETVAQYLNKDKDFTTGKVVLKEGVCFVEGDVITIKGIVPDKETILNVSSRSVRDILNILDCEVVVIKNLNNKGKIERSGIPNLNTLLKQKIKENKKDMVKYLAFTYNRKSFTEKEKVIIDNHKWLNNKLSFLKEEPVVTDLAKELCNICDFSLTATPSYDKIIQSRLKGYAKIKDKLTEVESKLPLNSLFDCWELEEYRYYLKLEKVIK